MEKELNYEKDLTINPDNMIDELMDQSIRYFRYSEQHAQSIFDRDRSKDNFLQIQADIDAEIRNDPDKFGLAKPTEPAIRSAVLRDKRYRKANKELSEATLISNTLEGATKAFEHRRKMLEKIVDLMVNRLYADPQTRRQVSDITSENLSERHQDALNESQKLQDFHSKKIRRIERS